MGPVINCSVLRITRYIMMLVLIKGLGWDVRYRWVAHNMKLLHIHYAPSAIHKRAIIDLSDVAVAGENVLLGSVLVLILIKLFANKQAINI